MTAENERRRRLVATTGSLLIAGTAGCLGFLEEEEPPDSPAILQSLFEALNEVDIKSARSYMHPESPIDLEAIEMTMYEDKYIHAMLPSWADPDVNEEVIESQIPDPILEHDDRTMVVTTLAVGRSALAGCQPEGLYEFRLDGDRWLCYDEIGGDAHALAPEPFPEC